MFGSDETQAYFESLFCIFRYAENGVRSHSEFFDNPPHGEQIALHAGSLIIAGPKGTPVEKQQSTLFQALVRIAVQLVTAPVNAQIVPAQMNIVIVDGEGAVDNIGQRITRDPVGKVEDENHKPITGAAVVFTLPTSGASGQFGNESKSVVVMTDSQGQAASARYQVKPACGKTADPR